MCKSSVGGFHFTALDVVKDNDTDITAVICTLRSVLEHTQTNAVYINLYVCFPATFQSRSALNLTEMC